MRALAGSRPHCGHATPQAERSAARCRFNSGMMRDQDLFRTVGLSDVSQSALMRWFMSPDQIRMELSRILASSAFQGADRAKNFLTFVVAAALDGRGDEIKESVIAVEALGR